MPGRFPPSISAIGGELDQLFWLITLIAAAWFVLLEGALLWSVWRYRRRDGVAARHLRGDSRRELAWLLVPAALVLVLDLAIDTASARLWRRMKIDLPPAELHVGVTARQFAWTIDYPGPDGRLGTADDFALDAELHVPAGRDVRVTLRSTDVLHSFFLPHARLKQDVVPGRAIDVWFNVTETGRFEVACAELCGFGHTTMKATMVVHTPEDFAVWLTTRGETAAGEPGDG